MNIDVTTPVDIKTQLQDLTAALNRLNRNMDKVIEEVYRLGYKNGFQDAAEVVVKELYGNEDDEDVQDLPF